MQRIEFNRRELLAGAACMPLLAAPAFAQSRDPWAEAAAIRARIKPPRFNTARPVRPQDFGGVADGKTLATDAFRQAVSAASKVPGGGRVLVEGDFLTGPIRLMSNVELHLAKGSTLRFSTDHSHYFPPVLTRFEGNELMGVSPFIYAYGCENIAITGEGTLDGQASQENWWGWLRKVSANGERDSDRLKRIAEEGMPVAQRVFGPEATIRPQFIQPYRCKNVLIEDVSIVRSPDPSSSSTIAPVRPPRCTTTSTPSPARTSVSICPAGSSPTCPMNRDRRPTLPQENAFVFYPRYLIETVRKLRGYWSVYRMITRIRNEVAKAPDRWTYTDKAIAPLRENELESLDLYHATRGGEDALARKHRQDAVMGRAAEAVPAE